MARELVIGLVSEGPTDYAVIKRFIEKSLSDASLEVDVIFDDIQPELDSTGINYERGGWSKLMAWCLRFPPADRHSQLFNPLFNNQRPLDLLIVQLDGDVLDEYAHHCNNTPVPSLPWSATKRGNYVEAVLKEWLWPTSSNEDLEKHVLLATVQDTEAWLVAGLNMDIECPEETGSVDELRQITTLPVTLRFPRGKLKKEPEKWAVMASAAANNLLHIRSTCFYCDKFLNSIEAAAVKSSSP